MKYFLNTLNLLKKHYFIIPILALISILAIFSATQASSRYLNKIKTKSIVGLSANMYKPSEVFVKYKNNTSTKNITSINKLAGAIKVKKEFDFPGEKNIQLLKLNNNVSVEQAMENIENNKNVEFVEPNYLRMPDHTPNDQYFSSQWGLSNTSVDADIDADQAWDLEKGTTNAVTVAVLDSGIDIVHPDLSSKVWINSAETAGDMIDNDANGKIDDYYGYNFAGIASFWYNAYAEMGSSATNQTFAQSIKGTGQTLTDLGINLVRQGTSIGMSNITVSVRSDLNGSNLSSYTVAPSEVNTFASETYKTLSTPIILASNTTYYIVVTTTNNNASKYFGVILNDPGLPDSLNDPFWQGQLYGYNGTWSSSDLDMTFRTSPNGYPLDDNGHGTHVSGIIAAQANNGIGVSGVSHGAKIMALKIADQAGLSYSDDVISAISYAAANGAKIANMSFGSSSSSIQEESAMNSAYSAGMSLFASAGNDGDSSVNYPSSYANVISVGATTSTDAIANYSNFNSAVDVSAPGSNIYSTYPSTFAGSSGYEYMSGTSMASPMAAGVAALVLAQNPSYTPDQVRAALQNNADDLGSAGRDNYFGYGRLNAVKALGGTDNNNDQDSLPDTTAPSSPSISSSTHSSSSTYYSNNDPSFSWVSTDDVAISGYSFEIDQSTTTTPDTTSDTTSTSYTYTDLGNGTSYFHVRAVDSSGNWGSANHYTIIIDDSKPKTGSTKKASVKKKKKVKLYYKVDDDYTGGIATVKIVIKRGSKVKKTINIGLIEINKKTYYNYKATLPKGKYKYYIYATDQAGNTQESISRNFLIIK